MIAHVPIQPINLNGLKYQKPWFRYVGNPNCSYLELGLYLAVEHVAMLTYYKFPDRPDRTLYAGDANCMSGSCPGHPGGSHKGSRNPRVGWRSIDFNYYTLVGYDKDKGYHGNRTQYVVGLESKRTTRIWDDTHRTDSSKMKLRPGIFDAERNAYFYFTLRKLLTYPGCRFGTHEILGNLMYDSLKYNDKNFLRSNSSLDRGTVYNHHMHVHAKLRQKHV